MPNQILSGVVVSDVSDKTIVVSVERSFKHKLYKKIIRKSKKYHVHDPMNSRSKGELVNFKGHRPLSKKKKWIIVE